MGPRRQNKNQHHMAQWPPLPRLCLQRNACRPPSLFVNVSQDNSLIVGSISVLTVHSTIYRLTRSNVEWGCIKGATSRVECRVHLHNTTQATLPKKLEGRDEFVQRLTAAVAWLNRHKKDRLWYFSTNQKRRADHCLATEPPGGRTKW